jgi:hypothetical protein
MSVELMNYNCKPEGGGVFQAYTNSQGAALIKSKTIALVMVGYRNASILLLERGQLTKLLSSNFGFIRLVEEVTEEARGKGAGGRGNAFSSLLWSGAEHGHQAPSFQDA